MRRPDSARSRSQMNRLNHSHLHSVCLQTLVESNANVTNITSLFAAIVNVRSVVKKTFILHLIIWTFSLSLKLG